MPTNVIMPALGLAQDTGKVLKWLKVEGESVSQGEPLMEVETDKVTVEIEAPASGILAGVRAAAGDVIPVGQVVAVIVAPGESPPAEVAPAPSRPTAAASLVTPTRSPSSKAETPRLAPASPKARRLARELGVDLSALSGSGSGGEVTAADVLAARSGAGSEQEITPGTIWRIMADRLTQSWMQAPHFYLLREVDATRLAAWRHEAHASIPQITYTDLIVHLTAAALREHCRINARWDDGRIVSGAEINIGIAVAVEDGLIVPVIHRADELSLQDVTQLRHDLVTRAQAGRLRPEDIRGGTFTISNLGMYGVDTFHPIVNPPQAAILGVGRIADRVVARDRAPAVRSMMTIVLSCDHRVVDGARGAEFLATLAALIEQPPASERDRDATRRNR